MFRVVDIDNLTYFNDLVKSCFLEVSEDIRVIGFDWLGRIFVSANKDNSKIYICDSGAHEILEVPLNILEFLNNEIPEYSNELFSTDFYNEYLSKGFDIPEYNQCIGYKIPLFLGGLDDISNI